MCWIQYCIVWLNNKYEWCEHKFPIDAFHVTFILMQEVLIYGGKKMGPSMEKFTKSITETNRKGSKKDPLFLLLYCAV